ncbi:hypothetical protein [Lacticaseibacillus kribbianus]|uniref:hypothetical protein n=1 Tax=Lacticaseibacillus kribbianus TaxID=2926292 RepID=UPI001CD72F89|nr:hypothetical protein [Lacticaseibacillus kribbianus]
MSDVPQAGARTRLLAALGRWYIRGLANPRLHLGVDLTVQAGRRREIVHVAPKQLATFKTQLVRRFDEALCEYARPKRRIVGYQPFYRIALVSICGHLGDCYELWDALEVWTTGAHSGQRVCLPKGTLLHVELFWSAPLPTGGQPRQLGRVTAVDGTPYDVIFWDFLARAHGIAWTTFQDAKKRGL